MQAIVKLNVRNDGGHVTWVDIDTSDAEGHSWLLTHSGLSEHVKSLLLEPKKVVRLNHSRKDSWGRITPNRGRLEIKINWIVEKKMIKKLRLATIFFAPLTVLSIVAYTGIKFTLEKTK